MDRNEPTMVADTTGNLFSSWTIMGSAQVQMQKNLSGTTKAVWISYDQPDLQSHIAVDTKQSNNLSLIFSSPHVGSSGKGISNGYADLNVMGGMIGTGIPNNFNDITTTATTVSIANNPYTTMDKTTSSGYQLASYAMRRDVSQYTYGKSARFNNDLHFAYYDKKNKALRYTYQNMSANKTSWQRTISGWILIDGKSDGQDRVHGGDNDIWSNDGYTLSNIKSNSVTFSNNVTAKEGDTLGIAYESKNGEHKFELFTISSDVNNSRIVTFDETFDISNYSDTPKGAIYKGASNVVTKGADKVSSAGSYLSLDVTNSGKPVIVYFDSDNETLRIAYSTK